MTATIKNNPTTTNNKKFVFFIARNSIKTRTIWSIGHTIIDTQTNESEKQKNIPILKSYKQKKNRKQLQKDEKRKNKWFNFCSFVSFFGFFVFFLLIQSHSHIFFSSSSFCLFHFDILMLYVLFSCASHWLRAANILRLSHVYVTLNVKLDA